MITKLQYVEFLISTISNFTGTHLAEHLDGVSHDTITDFLQSKRLTARHLWELVQGLIADSPDAFLIADDSVQDKRYSRFIELVRLQYSGTEHGLVRGIGVVNLVHSSGQPGDFYPIDYRVYDPDADGKTKNDYFRAMILHAIADKRIKARTVLFDSWYAGADNLKLLHRLGLIFFTTLKENRLVSLSNVLLVSTPIPKVMSKPTKKGRRLYSPRPNRMDTRAFAERCSRQVERSALQGAVIQAGRHKRRH
jgi:hypothetical protein